MSTSKTYLAKLSIPGKLNDELSYVFTHSVNCRYGVTSLFGIFHIKSTHELYQEFIQTVVKQFLDFYHTSEKEQSANDASKRNPAEISFEGALSSVHEAISHTILNGEESRERKRTIFEKKYVQFLIGSFTRDILFLNVFGSTMKALLFYPVVKKENFSHYASIDILDGGDEQENDTTRLFSSIISGAIPPNNSTLVFCNQSVADYVSADQLKQAITSYPIERVSSYFETLLTKAGIRNDFGAVFIRPHYIPSQGNTIPHPQTATNHSIEQLNYKAHGTSAILSPTLRQYLRISIGTIKNYLWSTSAFLVKKMLAHIRSFPYKKISAVFFLFVKNSLEKIGNFFNEKKLQNILSRVARGNFTFRFYKNFFSDLLKRFFSTYASAKEKIIKKFNSLSTVSRALLTLSGVFLFLFVFGLFSVHAKRVHTQREELYQSNIRGIEQTINLAEGSLIYDDSDRAKALLSGAELAIKTLRDERSLRAEDEHTIRQRMKDISSKMSRIVIIKEPSIRAHLESQIPSIASIKIISASPPFVISTNDALYTIAKDGTARQVDIQTKLPTIRCGIRSTQDSYYLCNGDGDKLYRINPEKEIIKKISVLFGPEEKKMDDIALYNGRLYVLDTIQGAIYRHLRIADGFGSGENWIKEKTTSLTDALGMTIDGTIFVLKRGNTILQYESGKPKPFILPSLEEPIGLISKIWTDGDVDVLYLLDATKKRILVIDKKNFALKTQFVSDAFTDLRDFAVNHKKREMVVLNGSDLLEFSIDLK